MSVSLIRAEEQQMLSVAYANSVYIHVKNFAIAYRYTPGNCEHITNQNQCLNARIGVKCVWHKQEGQCVQLTKVVNRKDYNEGDYMRCLDGMPPRGMTSHEELCKLFTDCIACVQTSYNCIWCGKSCSHEKCRDHPGSSMSRNVTKTLDGCANDTGVECLQLHTCHACSSNPRCIWSWSNGPDRCKPQSKTREVRVRMRRAYVTSLIRSYIESSYK